MQLVDAHCHFDFPFFDGHREAVLAQAASLGVRAIVIPGVRRQDWQRVASMADAEKGLWYCLGIHPWFIQEHGAGDLAELERLLSSAPQASVGLGECGLDALKGDLSEQEPWFEAQIDIAQRLGLALGGAQNASDVSFVLRDAQRHRTLGRTACRPSSGFHLS